MNYDLRDFDLQNIRGTDANSLLRLHDLANEIISKSGLQYERDRADKARQRIVKELQKRNLPIGLGIGPADPDHSRIHHP